MIIITKANNFAAVKKTITLVASFTLIQLMIVITAREKIRLVSDF